MKRIWALLHERSLWIFLCIGVGNTLVSLCIMFCLYNWLHLGYWLSTGIAFAVTSILSFVLNKKFSFQNRDSVLQTALRFALVIAVCYFVAYSLAQPLTGWLLGLLRLSWPKKTVEQIAMLTGQVVFTGMNYFGQRFFAFKKREV